MNKYLKIAISTGVPFGTAMAGIYYVNAREDITTVVALGAIAGIFFGAFMAGAFFAIGLLSDEDVSYGKTYWSQIMELKIQWEEALDLCRQSFKTLNKSYKFQIHTNGSAQIVAVTGITWRSFGEIISLNISRLTNSLIRIDISSKPKFPTTAIDWGANRRNVEAIARYVESSIESDKIVRNERVDPT